MNRSTLTVLSLGAHGVALIVLGRIHVLESSHASTAVEIVDVPKKPAPTAEPPPPPPPPKATPAPAKAQPRAAQPAAATPQPGGLDLGALASASDFGLSLSGIAVAAPTGAAGPAIATRAPEPVSAPKRALAPIKAAGCEEPLTKARLLSVPKPSFPEQAQASGVSGKVRVALTVDESGSVIDVQLLARLGHGFDEAALAAARAARFTPALRCGKPARSTFTIAMRFSAS